MLWALVGLLRQDGRQVQVFHTGLGRVNAVAPGPIWQESLRRLDPAEARYFASLAPYASSYAWDDVYEHGLQLLLDGLEARLKC